MAAYYEASTVKEAAKGQWLFIMASLAPTLEPALRRPGRHVSCPTHGGKDGFRLFKDAHETGGGVCNTCCNGKPHSDGFALLCWLNGWDFKTCLEEVGDYLCVDKKEFPSHTRNKSPEGTTTTPGEPPKGQVVSLNREAPKPWLAAVQEEMERKLERQRIYSARLEARILEIWNECEPLDVKGSIPVQRYFANRKLIFRDKATLDSESIRFHPSLSYYDGDGNLVGRFPAIVCAIKGPDGEIVTLHRTYLTETGKKAAVESPKKMMPIPDGKEVTGAAIRLGNPVDGVIGVTEGLETALSVIRVTKLPTWSLFNANIMETFMPPPGVTNVLIWSDLDRSKRGEQSALVLRERLQDKGIGAHILTPRMPIPALAKGVDWNDVLMSQGILGFPYSRVVVDSVAGRRTA